MRRSTPRRAALCQGLVKRDGHILPQSQVFELSTTSITALSEGHIHLAVAGPEHRHATEESRRPTPQPAARPDDDAVLAAAFRELHGARLHGFAMLVTLGDRQSAERSAGFALAAGAGQVAALRHPERAAAWLRARTLRDAPPAPVARRTDPTRGATREPLPRSGWTRPSISGLAALSLDARAALVASAIERFDPIDVETILDAAPATARRLVAEARGTLPAQCAGRQAPISTGSANTRTATSPSGCRRWQPAPSRAASRRDERGA